MATEESVKTVTLLDRQGREYRSSSPVEVNRLVYRDGYRLAGGLTYNDAIRELSGDVVVEPEPEPEPVKPVKPRPPVVVENVPVADGDDTK